MSLENFPNLGPKSAQMLAEAGITDEAQLRALGPVVAYLAVRQAGEMPSMNLLWAIAAGLQDRPWIELSDVEKKKLRAELDELAR